MQGQQQQDGKEKQGLRVGREGFKYTGATTARRKWEIGAQSSQRPEWLHMYRGNSSRMEWETEAHYRQSLDGVSNVQGQKQRAGVGNRGSQYRQSLDGVSNIQGQQQ
jgi:hypothetical protein